ncbi:MAG: rod shape-determining protein RodA [Roseburia sp.]|nr:rod shape-determining protein RodA [Roseburia sp.]
MLKQYKLRNYKFILVILVVALNTIGLLLVGSARPALQSKQMLGMVSGLLLMVFVSLVDYRFILKFSWLIYTFMVGLLLVVIFWGDSSGGAQRWIDLGFMRFQPSELAKILVILFFAYFFMKYEEKINTLKTLVLAFALAGVPLILILKQPDLSTTITTAMVFISMLFVAGISYKIVGTVLAIAIPAVVAFFVMITQDTIPFLEEYQLRRILAWLYPERYPDIAYQQQNSIMAIGSGQLWGKGLNNTEATSVKNGNFILEPQTDFIFAVAGEELGFMGTAAIILLLLFIVIECIFIARKAKDTAGKLICCGFAALVGFQSAINISVASGLLPNTGLPLPFVSYGLTSLWSLYIGVGLVLNVGLQSRKH